MDKESPTSETENAISSTFQQFLSEVLTQRDYYREKVREMDREIKNMVAAVQAAGLTIEANGVKKTNIPLHKLDTRLTAVKAKKKKSKAQPRTKFKVASMVLEVFDSKPPDTIMMLHDIIDETIQNHPELTTLKWANRSVNDSIILLTKEALKRNGELLRPARLKAHGNHKYSRINQETPTTTLHPETNNPGNNGTSSHTFQEGSVLRSV